MAGFQIEPHCIEHRIARAEASESIRPPLLQKSQDDMSTKNIVFIDERVSGYEALVANLGAETAWFLLDASRDGVEQMQRLLAGYTNLDAIHIISHGATGTLYLGSTVLKGDNLTSYQTQLQAIGSSLSETGDILLYGCNVAQGDIGGSFVNLFAQITGADVGASNDLTGADNGIGKDGRASALGMHLP